MSDRSTYVNLYAQPATNHPATPCASTPFGKVPAACPPPKKNEANREQLPAIQQQGLVAPAALSPRVNSNLVRAVLAVPSCAHATPTRQAPHIPSSPLSLWLPDTARKSLQPWQRPGKTHPSDPISDSTVLRPNHHHHPHHQPLVYCRLPYAPWFALLLSVRRTASDPQP